MTILRLILSFIPLALAAITPAMLIAVSFLLSLDRGSLRAGIFMTGRLLAYAGWCAVLFVFTDRVFDLTLDTSPTFIQMAKAIIGLLLGGMALKISLGGEDSDALPDKIVDLFTGISFVQLFGLGVIVSLFQVRHIILLFVGVTEIAVAELSITFTIFSAMILILMINASQLLLIAVYLALSDRAEAFIQSIDIWLTQHNRRVALIIGLIGIFLLWDGVSSWGIFG